MEAVTKSANRLNTQATPRFDTIDLLRGLAVLGVVLLHARLYLSFSDFEIGRHLPPWLNYLLFSQGGNGVSAFFAISGFLITFVSMRRFGSLNRLMPFAFYRIRVARILPLLLALLATLSVLHFAGPGDFRIDPAKGSLRGALFAALTFHINWYEAAHGWLPPNWTVLWSLSVEEMFYLIFPLLCVLMRQVRWGRAGFVVMLLGLIAFGPFARTPWYTSNDIWAYQSYLGNMDNVAMGCLFALLAERLSRLEQPMAHWLLVLFQLVGAALALFVVEWMWPKTFSGWPVRRALGVSGLDVTLLGVGVCLVMLGGVLRNRQGQPWSAPIRWLGRLSYEVYLTHEFVVIAVLSLFLHLRKGPAGAWVVGTVLLTAGLGYLVARGFSEPMNRRLRGAPLPFQL